MGLDISVERFVNRKSKEDTYDCHHYKLWEMDNLGNIVDAEMRFPEWVLKMKTTRKFTVNDWAKYKEQTGLDILNDYYVVMISPLDNAKDGKDEDNVRYGYVVRTKDEAKEPREVAIDIDEIPKYQKELPVVYYEERGYQRKGLNSQFYQDYEDGKIGYFVWTKAELERYLNDYVEDDMKDYFKKNIVDVFEDGKDVCIFDW